MVKRSAFSVIEMLAVIAIIGILAAVSFSMYNGARIRSRDTRRKTDLNSFKTAAVMYKNQYTTYPTVASPYYAYCDAGLGHDNWWNDLTTKLGPYLTSGSLPLDPLIPNGTSTNCSGNHIVIVGNPHVYMYGVSPDGKKYSMWAALENDKDPNRNGYIDLAAPLKGKYADLYYYNYIESTAQSLVTWTASLDSGQRNLDNVYGVGCHLVGAPPYTCVDN